MMHAEKGTDMSKKSRHIRKKNGKRAGRFTVKSCAAVLLSAVLALQSVKGVSVQAKETIRSGEMVFEKEENETRTVQDGGGETAETPEDSGSETPDNNGGGSGQETDPPTETAGSGEITESTGSSEAVETPADTAGNSEAVETPTGTTDSSETVETPTETPGSSETVETPTETPGSSETVEIPTETPETAGSGEAPETETETGTSVEPAEEGEETTLTAEEDTEGNPTAPEESEEDGTPAETGEGTEPENEGGLQFVTTPEGAVIIYAFEPLAKKESRILLDEKGTLEEVKAHMPAVLKAYAYVHKQTGEGESGPEEGSEEGMLVTAGKSCLKEILGRPQNADTSGREGRNDADQTPAESPEPAADGLNELSVPITWECVEDYENEELNEYHFLPVWERAAYFYDKEDMPTVTVKIGKEESVFVSTMEELAQAFEEGVPGSC